MNLILLIVFILGHCCFVANTYDESPFSKYQMARYFNLPHKRPTGNKPGGKQKDKLRNVDYDNIFSNYDIPKPKPDYSYVQTQDQTPDKVDKKSTDERDTKLENLPSEKIGNDIASPLDRFSEIIHMIKSYYDNDKNRPDQKSKVDGSNPKNLDQGIYDPLLLPPSVNTSTLRKFVMDIYSDVANSTSGKNIVLETMKLLLDVLPALLPNHLQVDENKVNEREYYGNSIEPPLLPTIDLENYREPNEIATSQNSNRKDQLQQLLSNETVINEEQDLITESTEKLKHNLTMEFTEDLESNLTIESTEDLPKEQNEELVDTNSSLRLPEIQILTERPFTHDPDYFYTKDYTPLPNHYSPIPFEEKHEPHITVGPLECRPGSEWIRKCHDCVCNKFGIAICHKILNCYLMEPGEPMKCKPYTQYALDNCNLCNCNGDGIPICTFMECNERENSDYWQKKVFNNPVDIVDDDDGYNQAIVPLHTKKFFSKQDKMKRKKPAKLMPKSRYLLPVCAPNTHWRGNCFDCICNWRGKRQCAQLDQCAPVFNDNPGICKPNTSFGNNCHQCICDDEGQPICDNTCR